MIVFSHSGNCLFLALLGYESFLTESENGAFLDVKLIPLVAETFISIGQAKSSCRIPVGRSFFYVLPRGLRAPCHPTLPDQDARGDGHHWLIPPTMCWFSAAASKAAAPYFTCWNEGSIRVGLVERFDLDHSRGSDAPDRRLFPPRGKTGGFRSGALACVGQSRVGTGSHLLWAAHVRT